MSTLDTAQWQAKILGIMQSAANKNLQISYDGRRFTLTGGGLDQPFVVDKKTFSELTVHEILENAGIEINPEAGK